MEWCQHCDIGKGCKIYEQRPVECRDFTCGWLNNAGKLFGEHWFPVKSHLIVSFLKDYPVMYIQTTQRHKNVWRKKPFLDEIIQIAKKKPFYVIIRDGENGWWVKNDGSIVNMQEAANDGQWIPPNA